MNSNAINVKTPISKEACEDKGKEGSLSSLNFIQDKISLFVRKVPYEMWISK